MERKPNKEENIIEEINLDNIEILEDTVAPGFGFGCDVTKGWFGFIC